LIAAKRICEPKRSISENRLSPSLSTRPVARRQFEIADRRGPAHSYFLAKRGSVTYESIDAAKVLTFKMGITRRN
jgi:hypothetical protein